VTRFIEAVVFSDVTRSSLRSVSAFGLVRWGVALAVGGLALLPLLYLMLRGLTRTDALDVLLNARTGAVVGQSLMLMLAVMLGAATIGLPFAWLTARTDLPYRRVWLIVGLLPMVIPTYLSAVTLIAAFGPRGALYEIIGPWLGIERIPSIYGFFGAWLTLTLATYPLLVLPVRAALLKTTPALEEAAADLGASRWRVFWRIVLPQCRPALASGMIFAGLYSLSDFGATAMMRYDNFTRVIYLQYANAFDRHESATLALLLVLMTLLLIGLEPLVSRGPVHSVTGTPHPPKPQPLGHWRLPALAFCGGLVFVGVVVPLLVIVEWLTTRNVTRMVEINSLTLTLNTLGVSLLSAVVAAVLALLMAGRAHAPTSRSGRWLLRLPMLGYALPGIVIGLSLVFFTTRYFLPLYQTLPMLVIAYLVRFLPLSLSATRNAFAQVTPRMVESAYALGANERRTIWRILLPLSRTGIFGGAALVFLGVMKELPITLMLAPTGFYTLPYRLWSSYQEAIFSQMGLPGLLLLLTAPLAIAIMLRDEGA
jgi:iron(III) transport system permease protein